MFNIIAEILEIIYKVWDSYGVTIIVLTVAIRLLVTPLTIKGTRSMLEMRKVQPEVRKLQAQYKNDRMRMNQELSTLYREHNINPLGGCFPLLIQMPVFLVLYQVIRGLTRRASEVGFALGKGSTPSCEVGCAPGVELEPTSSANFNPDWLDTEDTMFQDLILDNEMISWGLDLALSPWSILTSDIVRSLPYLFLVLMVGVLSYVQQRQISGRSSDDPNPQQRILMRIIPIFIPIISFSLPTALVIYFLTTNIVGVAQQAFLTRRIYRPHADAVEASAGDPSSDRSNGPIDTTAVVQSEEPEAPKGILGALGGTPEKKKHGSSPLSKPPKAKPPKSKNTSKTTRQPASPPSAKPPAKSKQQDTSSNRRAQKAKKSNAKDQKKNPPEPQKPQSKRITPKKDPPQQNRKNR